MTHRSLAVLIVLNLALLAGLSVTVFSPRPAAAQFGAGSQYSIIAGEVTGRSDQAALYIVDKASSRVAPVFFNGNTRKFETIFSGRVIGKDLREIARGRR